MRIVLISDTHGLHRQLAVPAGDLLIHAGDITLKLQADWMFRHFDIWLGELPHRHKIVIPGNNDYLLEDPKQRRRNHERNSARGLGRGNRGAEGLGVAGHAALRRSVRQVEAGRPQEALGGDSRWSGHPHHARPALRNPRPRTPLGAREGCPYLFEEVFRARPRLHVFGHIHAGYGTLRTDDTLFVNASLMGEDGSLSRKPVVVDFQVR